MRIDFVISDRLTSAETYAKHQGWVRKSQSSWTTKDGNEVRFVTRDCEFRNVADANVYLAYGAEKSPVWLAAKHWAKVGRVVLIWGHA